MARLLIPDIRGMTGERSVDLAPVANSEDTHLVWPSEDGHKLSVVNTLTAVQFCNDYIRSVEVLAASPVHEFDQNRHCSVVGVAQSDKDKVGRVCCLGGKGGVVLVSAYTNEAVADRDFVILTNSEAFHFGMELVRCSMKEDGDV